MEMGHLQHARVLKEKGKQNMSKKKIHKYFRRTFFTIFT